MNKGACHTRKKKLCAHGVESAACDLCLDLRMAATAEQRRERERERARRIKEGTHVTRHRQIDAVIRPCCQRRSCEVCSGLNRRVELVRKEAK